MNIRDFKGTDIELSGERFSVTYKIYGEEEDSLKTAQEICLADTIDFPDELLPDGVINSQIKGKIESIESFESEVFNAVISYAIETAEGELTQLLNVIFGNTSMKPGIQVLNIELPESLLSLYNGPRYGINGIREALSLSKRPLLSASLKPVGLTPKELSKLAYELALGGIDIVMDNHGLADQSFAPFDERVALCSEAVQKANSITGFKSIYVPNITAPYDDIFTRAEMAKKANAGALLIAPGLTGLDTMRSIADDISVALPIISHPSFYGSFIVGPDGISHGVILGQLMRLAGADVTIFPNYINNFFINKKECLDIVGNAVNPIGHLKSIFPCPMSGVNLKNIAEMLKTYGNDTIIIVDEDLYKSDIKDICHQYRKIVENAHML